MKWFKKKVEVKKEVIYVPIRSIDITKGICNSCLHKGASGDELPKDNLWDFKIGTHQFQLCDKCFMDVKNKIEVAYENELVNNIDL